MTEDPTERYKFFKEALCQTSGFSSSLAKVRSGDAKRFVKQLNTLERLATKATECEDSEKKNKIRWAFNNLGNMFRAKLLEEKIIREESEKSYEEQLERMKSDTRTSDLSQKCRRAKYVSAAVATITALALIFDWYKGENVEIVRIAEFMILTTSAFIFQNARQKHPKAFEQDELHNKYVARAQWELSEAKRMQVQTEFKLAALELLIQINNPAPANDNQRQAIQKPAELSIK